MTNPLNVDGTYSMLDRTTSDPADIASRIDVALAKLRGGSASRPGFLDLPEDEAGLSSAVELAHRLAGKGPMLLLGIGGSALGVRAIDEALGASSDPRLVVSDNVDPVGLHDRLATLDPARTLVNVVSKSGGTVETAAQWLVVHRWLAETLGDDWRHQVVVTTDPVQGDLRAWADGEKLPTLPVPSNVGGRFSVLTPVGLFPLAYAGHDVEGLLRGAAAARDACLSAADGAEAGQIAAFHLRHLPGRRMTVFSSYSDRLRQMGAWFQQLWSESLGKGGHGWSTSLAPGTTDQHSQVQLFMEGPDQHLFLFCSVERPAVRYTIPTRAEGALPLAEYLGGRSLAELLEVERAATAGALASMGRPSLSLSMRDLDAEAIGAFVMTFEIATAITGDALGINPYDQPGVELGKRLAFHALGKPGFEQAQ